MSDYVGDNKWIPSGESDADSQKLIWSTKIVNDLVVALDKGYRPQVSLPFYEGKQFLRKGNIVFEYTDAEIAELANAQGNEDLLEKSLLHLENLKLKRPEVAHLITNGIELIMRENEAV